MGRIAAQGGDTRLSDCIQAESSACCRFRFSLIAEYSAPGGYQRDLEYGEGVAEDSGKLQRAEKGIPRANRRPQAFWRSPGCRHEAIDPGQGGLYPTRRMI